MGHGASIADLVISSLSLAGALGIIVGFACSSQRHHIRQRVVLGLGITDLVQAADTMAGSINEIRGMPFVKNSSACNASGFFYQFSTFGSACLTLVIASITYASLAHPLSRVTACLEHRFAYLWLMGGIFLVSFVPALTLTLIYDMVDVRGVCWFVPGTNASNLVIFVPRAFVLVCVILLYTRLLVFFQRRDMKLFGTNSMSQTGEGSDGLDDEEQTRSKRFSIVLPRRMSNWTRGSTSTAGRPGIVATKETVSDAPLGPMHMAQADYDTRLNLMAPSYSPHALAPIPASPDPDGERDNAMPFSNFVPEADQDASSGTATSSPEFKDSRRPSDQPSALSQFRFDDSTMPQSRPALPRRQSRKPLSPRQVNRRLSVLLMLYPLAYAVLIAVSVARLIKQIANSTPSPALSNISRWLIYSQGLIDGLLFTVIRWVLFNFPRRSRT
ncbi:hypothetical protein JCM10212_004828 [Sporobolomyces blumeae]